jgi:hypothetical protein
MSVLVTGYGSIAFSSEKFIRTILRLLFVSLRVLQIVNMSGNSFRVEKLSTSNYEVWRVQMRCFLVHNKLWHTVRHTDARPSAADAEHACALILLHVEEMHFATQQWHMGPAASTCWAESRCLSVGVCPQA